MSEKLVETDYWSVPSAASHRVFDRAYKVVPGGVQGEGRRSSPYPLYMTRALGSRIWDVDGNEYLDYHAGFGSVILGHNHPEVRQAVHQALEEHGVTFATANPVEVELAERIVEMVPSAEKVVFSCTGSEATYHAVRLARGATGREKILKFEGHYHGWHDYVDWSVHDTRGSDDAPEPSPGSEGIFGAVRDSMVVCQYNDLEGLKAAVRRHGDQLAAIILEPVWYNGGAVLPVEGFLEACRSLCTENGIVLIFDEVISGFRHAPGGAQESLGVTPDLTTMGKAVANGFPISVLAGRADLMSHLTPQGDVLFAGTFAGHVLNAAAALKCTEIVRRPGFHERLRKLGDRLGQGIGAAIEETGVRAQIRHLGSVWTLYFSDKPIRNFRDLAAFGKDKEDPMQRAYRNWMLERGVYIHPHYMLRCFLTDAHNNEDIDNTVAATAEFLRAHRAALA